MGHTINLCNFRLCKRRSNRLNDIIDYFRYNIYLYTTNNQIDKLILIQLYIIELE